MHYICQDDDIAFGLETDGGTAQVDFDLPTPGFSNTTDLTAEIDILQSLRITELMYHPVAGSDFEYLRLRNIGTATINLGGVRFANGITLDLPAADLDPATETVIVRSPSDYQGLYGSAISVLGTYSGKLDNGGERVRLEIAERGYGILDFEYKDGWYPITDGGGASLVVADSSQARGLWSEKEGWMAFGPDLGTYAGWAVASIASSDADAFSHFADAERDGIINALEFALNLNPNVTDVSGLPVGAVEGDFMTLTYTKRKDSDAVVTPEVSGNLENWASGSGNVVQTLLSDDGVTETWKARDLTPVSTANMRYMRLHVVVP